MKDVRTKKTNRTSKSTSTANAPREEIDFTSDELKIAEKLGIVKLSMLREQIEMAKRQATLEQHPYKIWQGKDGKWWTYLPDKEKGRKQVKKSTQKAIEDAVVDYWKAETDNPTIEDIFNEWNDQRYAEEVVANGTHNRARQLFEEHYKEFGKRRIKSVSLDDYVEFLESRVTHHQTSASGFSNLKGITTGIITRAKRKKLIDYNSGAVYGELQISNSAYKKKYKTPEEEVFSEEELPIILTYLLKNLDKHNLGILLMFLTGIRVGELAVLTNADLLDGVITVNKTETRHFVKKGKYQYLVKDTPKSEAGNRDLVIPKDYKGIINILRALNPDGEFVFVNKKGKRMTTNCFRRRLERICKKLKIKPKSPHKARKTYISILLDNNIDRKLVEVLAGHTEDSCTESSYHRDRRNTEKKIDIISAIPDFRIDQASGKLLISA